MEDCPVCCQANTIHVHIERNGLVHVRAEPEQDRQ
ncbi:MAG: CPXCG motif-containing cysteine-rich protein [Pirellulaceae bacterium]